MAGIIANALNPATGTPTNPTDTGTTVQNNPTNPDGTTNTNVYGASTSPVDPTLRTVNPGTDTVSGQLSTILNSGSPLMQQAQSQAMDTANSRGLLNSSMAAGAGESAMIDKALPIASQDASTYNSNAATNTATQNQDKQFNAAATNASNQATANAANQSGLSAQTAEQDTALQTLKGTQATNLANIEANYKDLMQTSASAASLFNATSQNINSILADPNTSGTQKQASVNSATQQLQNSLNVIGSIANLNLGGLLDFSSTSVAPTAFPG